MLRLTPVALALAAALPCSAAQAQNTAQPQAQARQVDKLKEIVVSATRTERALEQVAASVTRHTRAEIEAEGALDIKDLFKNEVDLSVRQGPTRFLAAGPGSGRAGVEGLNIRGLEGNQVLLLVDGIRVPNSFSFASFSTGRGDYLALEGMQSLEVVRGPASAQFGSDGLAGALSLQTLSPADLLKKGQNFGGFARLNLAGVDRSWQQQVALARRVQDWQGMLLASVHAGHEHANHAQNEALDTRRTVPNPVDYAQHYLLAKLAWQPGLRHGLGLTLEAQRRRQDTEVYSARAFAPFVASSTRDLDTHDELERRRLSLHHHFDDEQAAILQKGESSVYWQDARVRQFSQEDRHTLPDRTRLNTFQTRILGFSTLWQTHIKTPLPHRLSFGVDGSVSHISALRDGTAAPFGETFPAQPFPVTRYLQWGAYAQSEIETGTWSILPALRYDRFQLQPERSNHAVFAMQKGALTPRLGLVWRVRPGLAPYAQMAYGFRAPTPDQVNNGFRNPASGYTSIGNPDLKPEYARSLEAGVRVSAAGSAAWQASLAVFDNHYRDFISQEIIGGAGTPSNPSVYQYVNLRRAHIYGMEARGSWQLHTSWQVQAALAWMRGTSQHQQQSVPLDTVNPLQGSLRLRYQQARLQAWLQLRASGRQKHLQQGSRQYVPPAWATLDLGAQWRLPEQWMLSAGVQNLLNRKYWTWGQVRGIEADSAVKDAYTAAGRQAQLSLRYSF